MDIHGGGEKNIGNIYYVLLLTIVIVAVIFLLCDFNILPGGQCAVVNKFASELSDYVNKILDI